MYLRGRKYVSNSALSPHLAPLICVPRHPYSSIPPTRVTTKRNGRRWIQMMPVRDAMAIAMPGVEKFDRKILVAYLRPPRSQMSVFSGAFRVRFLLANMLANICDRVLLANSSKKSQIWDICYICDHICKQKMICTSKFIECLQIIIIFYLLTSTVPGYQIACPLAKKGASPRN